MENDNYVSVDPFISSRLYSINVKKFQELSYGLSVGTVLRDFTISEEKRLEFTKTILQKFFEIEKKSLQERILLTSKALESIEEMNPKQMVSNFSDEISEYLQSFVIPSGAKISQNLKISSDIIKSGEILSRGLDNMKESDQ